MKPITSVCGFLVLIFTLGIKSSFAQTLAGDIPTGTSAVNPNINLSVIPYFTDTSAVLDLDCDMIPDIELQLARGESPLDAPNAAVVKVTNLLFEMCAHAGTTMPKRMNLYYLGDSLNCTVVNSWANDSSYVLGDYGCFSCTGPSAVQDMYFAYKKGTRVGWVKITFNIDDASGPLHPITMTVTDMLVLCNPSTVSEDGIRAFFRVIPNPSRDGKIKIQSREKLSSVELFNALGQRLENIPGNETEISLPAESGIYFLRARNEKGQFWQEKVIRQ